MMPARHSSFLRQWGWPIGLALLMLLGLFSALLGQGGVWWGLSWIALAAPLLVALWHILHSGGASDRRR